MRTWWVLLGTIGLLAGAGTPEVPASQAAAAPSEVEPEVAAPIAADRRWQVLAEPGDDLRPSLRAAGEALGDWTIHVAGVALDGPLLARLAETRTDEPVLRVVREELRRPFDLLDLLYLLDDVLVAGEGGRRGERFDIGAGRARASGVLIHPDDVFRGKPRVYPRGGEIAVDRPPPQESWPPAEDGQALGPGWTMRYRNPTEPREMFVTLHERRPDSTFPSRVAALVTQLEAAGAEVYLTSFLRWPERGYLMWGAFELSRCGSEACVDGQVARLEDRNRAWGLGVPITWRHPDGWEATREAARQMKDAYDVVYATENGARSSHHYDGVAADFVAVGLPRELTLHAPDGSVRTFDLSHPDQPRDLSLTPELIDWVEVHFGLRKLNADYPHWTDAIR